MSAIPVATPAPWTVERALRGVAGAVVLLRLFLEWAVHPYFLGLTAFAGANNLQSAFTDWCPMVWLLERFGLPRCGAATRAAAGA